MEQSENEAERPWGEKEEQHQERETSGEAKGKENHNISSKDKFIRFANQEVTGDRGCGWGQFVLRVGAEKKGKIREGRMFLLLMESRVVKRETGSREARLGL